MSDVGDLLRRANEYLDPHARPAMRESEIAALEGMLGELVGVVERLQREIAVLGPASSNWAYRTGMAEGALDSVRRFVLPGVAGLDLELSNRLRAAIDTDLGTNDWELGVEVDSESMRGTRYVLSVGAASVIEAVAPKVYARLNPVPVRRRPALEPGHWHPVP